jgi:hypothetical protein
MPGNQGKMIGKIVVGKDGKKAITVDSDDFDCTGDERTALKKIL